jgi:tetraacyldisaccharide 4'-kinase
LIPSFLAWGERYLFAPRGFDYLISFLLLPLSLFYTAVLFLRFLMIKPKELGIPVISIGNLVIGGSGKTPVTIALASQHKQVAVVLRGYGRNSKGTIVISDHGNIVEDVSVSGDEAMLLAKALSQATVIVASDRIEGIRQAKELGCKVVFLDDGYSKHFIKKLDIILEAKEKPYLPFCIPSGPYREKRWWGKKVHTFTEEVDFKRSVTLLHPTSKMLLVTAISKPWRLDPYLPEVVGKKTFIDHYSFQKQELETLMRDYQATSILTTQKDAVKMEKFGLNLSILELSLEISDTMSQLINQYIENYECKKI